MCGIAGVYCPTQPVSGQPIKEMVSKLIHRGPDTQKFEIVNKNLQLGHTRLSIIDTSRASHQPLVDSSGNCLVYNGEIFNYKTLASKMGIPEIGDSRVLLKGLSLHGMDFLKELEGMFAFAYWNNKTKQLFLARDRFGIKPLFIGRQGELIYFASEIKAILPLLQNPTVDRRSINDYLSLGYIVSPATPFEEVKELNAGSYSDLSAKDFKCNSYSVVEQGKANNFDSVLQKSAESHMVSDVPVSLLLSGGLDSTCLAVATRNLDLNYHFLDMTDEIYSEKAKVQKVAELLDLDVQMTPSEDPTLKDLFHIVYHLDDLISDPAILSNYQLYRSLRGSKVVLGGDGADELFLGYSTYFASQLTRWKCFPVLKWPLMLLSKALMYLPAISRYPLGMRLQRLLTNIERPFFLKHLLFRSPMTRSYLSESYNRESHFEQLNSDDIFSSKDSFLLKLSKLDFKVYLQSNLLKKIDRLSMMFSIEARVPFVSENMQQFAFSLRDTEKASCGEGKLPLREYLKKRLGSKFLYKQRKVGFGFNLEPFLETEEVSAFAKRPCEIFYSIICQAKFLKLADKSLKSYNEQYAYFNLLVLKIWLNIHVKGCDE